MPTGTLDPKTMEAAQAFAFQVFTDLAAAISVPHLYMGDRLGLFKLVAAEGPMTVETLAKKSGLQERYLREWTGAMAASSVLDYDAKGQTFALPPAKAAVLVNEESPFFIQGFTQMVPDHYAKIPGIMKCMKAGGGVPYSEYGPDTFEGTERFFKPGYVNFLVQQWMPATGYDKKLAAGGAKVADVGCGRGVAIVTLAKAFPKSTFVGFDAYAPSVEAAKANAAKAGVSGNTKFETRASTDLPATGEFDLIMNLDSLHDMADPEGAARSVKKALKPDGAWFVVEPKVSDKLEENLNTIGRAFYSISMLQCMTVSLAQNGKGYGACMGPGRLAQIVKQAGFTRHDVLPIDNPFNAMTLSRA